MIMNLLVFVMLLALMIGTLKMRNHAKGHQINGDKSVIQFQHSVNKYLKGKKK